MPDSSHYDLFVSYAEADRAWVEGYLLEALEQAGVRFICESTFTVGVPRLLEFERAIQQSKYTLLIISPDYLADELNEFIATMGQSYGQDTNCWPVIPLIRQSVPLPSRLGMLVSLKATNEQEQEAAVAQLCAHLERPIPATTPLPDCPYPGMKPFSASDCYRFFGRDREIGELLECLRLYPFITVIGPSGSGKSSLVFAGLIPALQEHQRLGSGEWRIQSMRPGEQPETTLRQILTAGEETTRLLLVIDQFEEVFTLAKEEAVPFQKSLLKLIQPHPTNVYLVLTVRADFYADLMTSSLWQEIQNYRLEVIPLTETGLRQSIVKPAEEVGVFVEPALVERLVTDAAGEPGVLPLIQETLVLLWQRLERRFLPLRAYEALVLPRTAYGGQETGQKTGLQVAIARRANQTIKDLRQAPELQQAIARRIFLRLVQFGEGRADTRRQQAVDALRSTDDDPQLFNLTLAHLVECRLITLSGEDNTSRNADIAHEALISGWPTLQQWIAEHRDAEKTRRRLEARTQDWLKLNKKGGLLDPVELEEFKRLHRSTAAEFGLSSNLYELIKASQQAAQIRKIILGAYIVFITGAAIIAGLQWRNAEIGQIKALSESSKAKFTSNRSSFDALLDALTAGKLLQQLPWGNREVQLKADVMTALTESVFWVQEKNRLEGHVGVMNSLSFSPNSQTIASASGDGTIKLWQRDGINTATLSGHQGGVMSVSFHSNGQILASSSLDGTVRLWKQSQNGDWNEDEQWRKRFSSSQDDQPIPVRAVRFSPDGRFVAAAGDDGMIKIWKLESGKISNTLKGHKDIINSLSFSPNGQILASASHDGTIKLWQWQNSQEITISKDTAFGREDRVMSVQFSPDGRWLLAGSLDTGTVKLWNWNGRELTLRNSFTAHRTGVRVVDFSADSKMFASAGQDNLVKLWQLDGTVITELAGHSNFVTSVSFSPDNQIIASASNDSTVKLWQLEKPLLKVLNNHNYAINSVSLSGNNQLIAAASNGDHTVKLWRADGTLINDDLTGHTDRINNLSFDINEQKIASASKDGTIKFWKLDENGTPECNIGVNREKRCYENFLNEHNVDFINVSFSPDNRLIAIAARDGTIQLRQVKDHTLITTLKGHQGIAYDVRFSMNGQMLASVGEDGIVKLWKIDGTLITETQNPNDQSHYLYAVRFSPNDEMVAAASSDHSVKLWKIDAVSKELVSLPALRRNQSAVAAISFNPQKPLLASANDKGTIFIWNLDGTLVTELTGHSGLVGSLNFSSDGTTLISGSDDASIMIWKLDSLSLDHFISLGCHWIQDYLETNPNVLNTRDRHLCDTSR